MENGYTKDLTEIKNEVAQKHGYVNWADVIDNHALWAISDIEFISIENEAMLEYAKQCCEAQRESDANIQTWGMVYKEYKEDLKQAILKNPINNR